jgi:hypothetical protein
MEPAPGLQTCRHHCGRFFSDYLLFSFVPVLETGGCPPSGFRQPARNSNGMQNAIRRAVQIVHDGRPFQCF